MTKPWPNSMYADGQVSPDPLAFCDPPTRADKVRADQMVAQSCLGMATFLGAQVMLWLPGVFESLVALNHSALTILFGVLCFASGILGHVIVYRLSSKSMFSPHMAIALKIALGPKPKVRALSLEMVLIATGFCGFGVWLLSHENVPQTALDPALGVAGAATSLIVAVLLVGYAFQQMKRAIEVATAQVDQLV